MLLDLQGRFAKCLERLKGSGFDMQHLLMSRWLWCALVVLVIGGRGVVGNSEQLLTGGGDTDDIMRLVQIREFLSHGNWFDSTITQVGAPDALVSHWSRLLDVPIASLIVMFGVVFSSAEAEMAARIVWPLLLLFALTLLVFRDAERRGGVFAGVVALLFIFSGIAATNQFGPGRIDHHNVQILCAVAGILFLLRSFREPQFGWAAGGLLGLGLSVGLEALPLVIAVLGIVALCAAFEATVRDGFVRALVAAAFVLGLTFVVTTPPSQWYHMVCDANALNLIALASVGAAATVVVMARWPNATPWQWIGGLALGGGLGVAAYLALEPACAAGPFGKVDPAIGPIWLDHVFEVKTLYHLAQTTPSGALSFLAFVGLGVMACWFNWQQSRNIEALAALAVMIIVAVYSCIYLKLLAYAMWLSIIPVALLVTRLPAFGELPERSVRIGAAVFCSQTMMLAVFSTVVGLFTNMESKSAEAWTSSTAACQQRTPYRELAALPRGLVASEIDLGPFIAINTEHRVIAAPYHRIDKSIIASHRIFSSEPAQSAEIIDRLGVRYVVVCQRDQKKVGKLASGSLMQRLQRGETIAYLEPVTAGDSTSPVRIWRVKSL